MLDKGFWKGKGFNSWKFALISDTSKEPNTEQELSTNFLDMERANGKVNKDFWDVLRMYAVGRHLRERMQSFHNDVCTVCMNSEQSKSFQVGMGLRQE